MNQARVDILLALRTQMQGNTAALTYLDQLEKGAKSTAASVDSEMDKLQGKLAKKFSASSIGFNIIKGFGLGSGFAIINHVADMVVEAWQSSAKYAKEVEERAEKIATAMQRTATAMTDAFRKNLSPADRLSSLQREEKLLSAKADQLEAQREQAQRGMAFVTESSKGDLKNGVVGGLSNFGTRVKSFEGEKFGSEDTGMGGRDFFEVMQKKADDAQLAAAGVREKIAGIRGEMSDLAKQIAEEKKRDDAEKGKTFTDELEQDVKRWEKALSERLKNEKEISDAENKFAHDRNESVARSTEAAKKLAVTDSLAAAIDKSNDALRDFDTQLGALEKNPFLTDIEKHAQRTALLEKENAAIAEQIRLLKQFAQDNPGVDPAAVRGQVRGLNDRGAKNSASIGAPDLSSMGVGANLEANIVGMENRLRTPAQGIADTITDTIGGAFSSIEQNISGLVMGTESWGSALQNIGQTITGTLINGIIKMFVTWIEQRALAGVANMLWSTEEGAADAAAKAPGAALTSISSYGIAAALGIAALVAAMAAFGGFRTGGFTDQGHSSEVKGVVHANEWVAPDWMVSDPHYGPQIAGLEAARQGIPGFSGGGFSGNFKSSFFDIFNPIKMFKSRWHATWHPIETTTPDAVPGKDYNSAELYAMMAAQGGGSKALSGMGFSDGGGAYSAALASQGGGGGGGGVAGGGSIGGPGGKPVQIVIVDSRDTDAYERAVADPRFNSYVQRVGRRDRGA